MKRKFYPVLTLIALFFLQSSLLAQPFSLLKDINPGTNGSSYFNFTNVDGVLYFRPDDGAHGDELWKTDGTVAGTVMVKDIFPGAAGCELELFTNVNGVLFFKANDGVHGAELWKSDGTASGTVMVKDIYAGSVSSSATSFYSYNGYLYFNANDGIAGRELWRSDGTPEGTVMVKDIFPGVATSGLETGTPHSGNPQGFTGMNGHIYFLASDDYYKSELWRTDGTSAGTTLIKDIYPGSDYALNNFVNVNGTLFFTVYKGTEGNELWKSDGTSAGTVMITELFGGNFDNHGVAAGNYFYFLETDGLWRSDGSAAGTLLLKPRDNSYFNTVEVVTTLNGQVYFTGYDDTHGWELWKTDGTVSGTQMIKDINAGSVNSDINSFAKVGNKLMFTANDGVHGNEIWITDGTLAGTRLVQDIVNGSGDALPIQLYEFKNAIIEANGKIFAGITTSALGMEVWAANMPSEIGLPLELLTFEAWLQNNDGKLRWTTENESNTDNFLVERSLDGISFHQIGTVAAINTTGSHQYDYTDANITSIDTRTIYYRLRQVDLDGSYVYSKIVSIDIAQEKTSISLYPNPVQATMNLSISLPRQEQLKWQLMDNSGRLIRFGQYNLLQGRTVVTEDISNLARGVYYLEIRGEKIRKVIKVNKQ